MRDKCGRQMEGKKRVVPGEVCAERAERRNHSHKRKAVLNAQKSAEAIVSWKGKKAKGRAEPIQPE